MPVMVGPTGLSGLLWPGGELCSARAATAAGTAFCLSHGSVCTIEELAATGVAPRWMQVFVYRDRGLTREFAERAKATGYDALVLTTDNQLTGNRERDIRNGFTIPPRSGRCRLAQMAIKVPWLWRMRNHLKRVNMWNYVKAGEVADLNHVSRRLGTILDPSLSWRDVDEIRKIWPGRCILKGVLHPEEARDAADARRRRHHRLQPWRTPARRRRLLDRGAAGGRRRGRRPHAGAARRRRETRRGRGEGAGARRERSA